MISAINALTLKPAQCALWLRPRKEKRLNWFYRGLRLLAVTVLTSFDESDLADLGYPCQVSDLVALRVGKAVEAGVDGIVCSPLEVARVRSLAGPDAILVTPGVRSAGAGKGDQKRVATPAEAVRDGANYLVIGRQVTRAQDPRSEVLRICDEILAMSQ